MEQHQRGCETLHELVQEMGIPEFIHQHGVGDWEIKEKDKQGKPTHQESFGGWGGWLNQANHLPRQQQVEPERQSNGNAKRDIECKAA
ncbi:MAG: hypothetical protein UZ07_CHB004003221 [Chlorobi bacterium OLB7]|nr:MAG: hypothetical protein UZ07_CHB004003221 [Chlorobi bacterium OLB7]